MGANAARKIGGYGKYKMDDSTKQSVPSSVGSLLKAGSTQPGRAYIVGERQPELFVPHSAGTVIPSVPSGGSTNNTTVIQNINTPDADSFKRSSGQISSMMGAAASRGSQQTDVKNNRPGCSFRVAGLCV